MTQIIFESEKKAAQYAPLSTLRKVIQNENGSISSYLAKLGAFPQDYMEKQKTHQTNSKTGDKTKKLSHDKSSFDKTSFKNRNEARSLEERVAAAVSPNVVSSEGSFSSSEVAPDLPNPNKSLNSLN